MQQRRKGYEQQFALNHLAGFLLTHYMMPYLKNANGRIIMTGQAVSHKKMKIHWQDIMFPEALSPPAGFIKQSKLCNMLFAKSLNVRYSNQGINAYVVDPGLVQNGYRLQTNRRTGKLRMVASKKAGRIAANPG